MTMHNYNSSGECVTPGCTDRQLGRYQANQHESMTAGDFTRRGVAHRHGVLFGVTKLTLAAHRLGMADQRK